MIFRNPFRRGTTPEATEGLFGTGTSTKTPITEDTVHAYLNDGMPLVFTSSNVYSAGYDIKNQKLTIVFNDGATYRYPANPEMALSLAQASSKGKWIHDHLRRPDVPKEKIA